MAAEREVILAGGCFWCLEHDMQKIEGVFRAESGYAGGTAPDMTYEKSHDFEASGGHVEAVKVVFDEDKISFKKILQAFMGLHDYTDVDGQFCDRGKQYAPVIFVKNAEERAVAEAVVASVKGAKTPVVDYDPPLADDEDGIGNRQFWTAEEYHQDYAEKNPTRYTYYRWSCGRDKRLQTLKPAL